MTISWSLVHPYDASEVLLSSSADADPAYFYSYMESNIFAKFLRSESEDVAPVYGGEEAETFVEDLAAQVVREAPHKLVGPLLSCLSCAFWKNKGPRDLNNLPDANSRKICGRVFKVGEVVWTCRQCAKDATCVQCDACFKASDHEGHEVYFHRAAATSGGCCDCGDEEAWATSGNCAKHSRKGDDRDPLEALPEPVQKGLNAVMKGALGVTISFSTAVVRGFNVEDMSNPYTKSLQVVRDMHRGRWFEDMNSSTQSEEVSDIMKEMSTKQVGEMDYTFCLSLHNDDVHTYDEVTRAILTHVFESSDSAEISKAEALTKLVDQEGFAVVASARIDANFGSDQARTLNKLHSMARKLRMPLGESSKGLLTTIMPEPLITMERGVAAYLNWVQDLGKANDGICRLMTNVLLMDTEDLPGHAAAMVNRRAESGVACGICRPTEIFDEYLGDDPEANMGREFPIYLKQLSDYKSYLEGASDEIQIDADKDKKSKINAEAVRLTTAPFAGNCKRNALAVLLMASAYLFKRVKDRISSLVVIYQQDVVFKPVFSQTLTVLYPALYGLFARYIGTRSDEIFNTTVQVYTANRIVTMMSSDGYQKGLRPLPEPEHGHVCIAKMLAHTIYTTMLHIGCNLEDDSVWPPTESRDKFLKAHALMTQRYQQAFRDFEYVTENIVGNLDLLTGDRDQGVLWIWMAVCAMLQGMYAVKRVALAHVEHEEQIMWHTSTNLTLEMESASTNIISNSLFPSEEALLAESQVASGKDDAYDMRELQNLAVKRSSAVFAQGFADWADRMHQRDLAVRGLGLNHDQHEPDELLREKGRYSAGSAVPFTCLEHSVELPKGATFMRFAVAEDEVSINIPLHRLVAKLFMYSAYNDLNLRPAFEAISGMSSTAVLSLADYPLRVMSFSAQVDHRMWVRNGQAVANLAFNYSHGPIVKYLKVMDIHAVQTALIALGETRGPSLIVALMIDRCGVSKMLERKFQYFENAAMNQARPGGGSTWAAKTLLEHQGPMLCILLKILIDVITNTPTDLTAFNVEDAKKSTDGAGAPVEYADSVETALSREVASLVLSGVSSLGQLQVAKAMVGGDKTVNDNVSYKVMERLCRRKAGEGDKMLEPNAETFKYFDPEFTHRSQDQLNKAVDEVREQRKKEAEKKDRGTDEAGAKEEAMPLFLPEMVPASNRFFEPVRNVLYTPVFYSLLTRSIELAIAPKAASTQRGAQPSTGELLLGPSSRVVAERVIYLLTVHLHVKNRRRHKESVPSRQEYPSTASAESDMQEDTSSSAEEEATFSGESAATVPDGSFDCNEGGRLSVEKHSTLLQAIADLWHSPLVSDDPLYRDGLLWVMKQIALDERNEGAMELFASRGLAFRRRNASADAGDGVMDGRQTELQKRKEAAQRSVMMNMSKQAEAFAAMMDDLTSSDEDEPGGSSQDDAGGSDGDDDMDVGTDRPDAAPKHAHKSVPKCIVCRESEGSSPMGTLCYLQPSSVVKNTILHHASTWHECSHPLPAEINPAYMRKMYRVVARRGCLVYKTAEDTASLQSVRSASIVGRLAHGEHLLTRRRVSRWVQVVSPLQGWVEIYSERRKVAGESYNNAASTAYATNEALFDHGSAAQEVALVTNLQPLSTMLFNKHGGERIHASTCGHNIHYHCWNSYYASCVQQAERQIWGNEFRAALDIFTGEFTCPLCKSISNAWLPFVPSAEARLSWQDEEAKDSGADGPSILPFPQQDQVKQTTLNQAVLRILDSPTIDNFGRNFESQQFLERCISLHRQAWLDRRKRYNILAENSLSDDPDSRREAELTRGVHILAGTIAYTIQSNLLAGRWTGSHAGLERAAQAAFPSKEALEFAAEQLNLIRQMSNWFPSRESFEDCVGTPLKFLLAGKATVPELVGEAKTAPEPAPVLSCADSSHLMNSSAHMKGMLRALATSPYSQIVTETSLPSEQHLVATRRAFFDKGIPASQLWGFLSVPLLSQDLHTIAVVAVAGARNVDRARDALSLIALARLCQVLLEPAVSGVAKKLQENVSSHLNGTPSDQPPPALPFRRTASSDAMSYRQGGGGSPVVSSRSWSNPSQDSDSAVTEVAALLQHLQTSLASRTGQASAPNPEWSSAPAHVLRLALEGWLPFLEYSLALLTALQCAAGYTAGPPAEAGEGGDEAGSIDVLDMLQRIPALLSALQLPSSLSTLLSSDFLSACALDWATQLSFIQRPSVPPGSLSGENSPPSASGFHPLVPSPTARSALDPAVSREREQVRFSTRDNEFWHETSSFGYPRQVAELVSALSCEEIGTIIDKFREELKSALSGGKEKDGGGGEKDTAMDEDEDEDEEEEEDEDLEGRGNRLAQFARLLASDTANDNAQSGESESESEYRYQWRLLSQGEMGPLVEREMHRLVTDRIPTENGEEEAGADGVVGSMDTDDNDNGSNSSSSSKAAPRHISSALKRQRKDLSDAVAFAGAVKDAIMKKMALLELKSVEGHTGTTRMDESLKQEGLACLVDALMTCSDEDLDGLKSICQAVPDSASMGERFGRLLVHKAKCKSARELGVELKDPSAEGSALFAIASAASPSSLKPAAGTGPGESSGSDMVVDGDGSTSSSTEGTSGGGSGGSEGGKDADEEEERLLSESPMASWKLVGLDPRHRMTDEAADRRHVAWYRDLRSNLGYFFTESPFVGSVQGCAPCYDLGGKHTSTPWSDLSHMGLYRSVRGGLVELPRVYTDMIQRMRLPYKPQFDEQGRRIDEPAICLVCGTIVRAGNRSKDIDSPSDMDNHLETYPGECTLHARRCGGGHGIFMIMLHNWVLILNGPRSCKYSALYLDKNGEAGEGRGPNRPLQLSEARYKKLEELYLNHGIASEISRKRLNQDRNIRMNYY